MYSQYLSPPLDELPKSNWFRCMQERSLHKFGQHLPPMALQSESCLHLGVQVSTFVDEGQPTKQKKNRSTKNRRRKEKPQKHDTKVKGVSLLVEVYNNW